MIPIETRSVLSLAASQRLKFQDYDTGRIVTLRLDAISGVEGRRPDAANVNYTGEHAFIDAGGRRYHVRSSDAAVLAAIDAAAAAAQPFISFVHVEDQKAQNTAGGTFTTGAWRTRDLNTEVSDVDGLASLSLNQLTLAAGIWVIWVSAPANSVGRHQIRLQDLTAGAPGTTLKAGSSEAAATALNTFRSVLVYRGAFTSPTVLEVQHQGAVTVNTIGFGSAANFTAEVYTILKAWKIGEA